MTPLTMYIVSDSVGETADLVAKAAISQFRHDVDTVSMKRFANVDNLKQIEEIALLAQRQQALIVHTLVKSEMRDAMAHYAMENGVQAIDLIGPIVDMISGRLEESPFEEPGLVRQLDDDYFKKIEAIEFAVKYDDGRDPRGILLADIVLVGVSRTSKTPLSQYLAHHRYKVANVPLVPEVEPPEELLQIDPKRCFGLVISPEKLNFIRKERLIALGLKDDASYAKVSRIEREIEHFEKVVERVGCRVINVTNRAVEETANIILEQIEQLKQ
ncbi:pyruvate, water dikinase regulatory protein [Savagea faecisuis]|uniref:Putative pyruvate, phosphate dikinase regulatory protein n=1 Tax=Savagea faecisuis TaxID=1274803 RepID=A0ABW3GWK0_9BACL